MSLEQVLKQLEQGKGPVRDPELYFLTIFGTPSDSGKWGWRVEGHHLSLNFVLEDGKIIAATPASSAPTLPRSGRDPRKACAPWPTCEDTALRLVQALDGTRKRPRSSRPKPPTRSAPPTRLNRPPTAPPESPTAS